MCTYNNNDKNKNPATVSDHKGQNKAVGIGLIKLTETSDTSNYKSFFKHCILQTILHVFLLFTFVRNKIFCSKN